MTIRQYLRLKLENCDDMTVISTATMKWASFDADCTPFAFNFLFCTCYDRFLATLREKRYFHCTA